MQLCNEHYIGKTQRYLKKRTAEHIGDVWKVVESGRDKFGEGWFGNGGYERSDSFAVHFADHCRDCNNSNEVKAKMKRLMDVKILWQGKQIQSMKSACTLKCKLCMMERKEIAKKWRTDKKSLINDRSEIFGSCKCRTRFHRFTFGKYAGTDEEFNSERDSHSINSDLSSENSQDESQESASQSTSASNEAHTYNWELVLPVENLANFFEREVNNTAHMEIDC